MVCATVLALFRNVLATLEGKYSANRAQERERGNCSQVTMGQPDYCMDWLMGCILPISKQLHWLFHFKVPDTH